MSLTRFEKARIISARALQVSMGAPVLVKVPKGAGIHDIVLRELEEGVLPLTVVRKMPDGESIFLNVNGEVFGETKK